MASNGVAKTHQSCPICTHNDCVTVFSNGTAWCHSHCIEGKDKPFKYNQETIEEIETSKGDYITHEKFEAHTYKCTSETGSLVVFTKGVRGGKFYEDDTFRLEKKLI